MWKYSNLTNAYVSNGLNSTTTINSSTPGCMTKLMQNTLPVLAAKARFFVGDGGGGNLALDGLGGVIPNGALVRKFLQNGLVEDEIAQNIHVGSFWEGFEENMDLFLLLMEEIWLTS